MSFVNIKKEIINRMSANITSLQRVYGYEKIESDGFPYATVVRHDSQNAVDTTTENLRDYQIKVTIFEQMGQNPPGESSSDNAKDRAERIIDNLLDEIITYFDDKDNNTLGGNITWMEPVPSRSIYVQAPGGWYRGAEIILVCHKHISVT